MINQCYVTIFTPSYNRVEYLKRLYELLWEQACTGSGKDREFGTSSFAIGAGAENEKFTVRRWLYEKGKTF